MKAYCIYLVLISFQWWFIKHISLKGSTVEEKDKKKRKYFLIIACAELIILTGIRGYSVGADTSVYLSALEYYKEMSKSEILHAKLVYPYDFEMGYFFLTKLCAFLNFSKTSFLFLISTIIYIPIFAVIYKRSSDPYVSVLTYFAFGFFSYSLGIFRQMIALSIVICGIQYIKERKFFKYLFFIIIAMTFHSTALLALIIYFLYPVNWKVNMGISVFVSLISIPLGNLIINFMIKVMSKYSGYLERKNTQGGSYLMLALFVILLILQCLSNYMKTPTEFNKTVSDALSMTVVAQTLGYSLNIFGRSISYFSVFLIFLIPSLIEMISGKLRFIVKIGVIMCLLVLIFINLNGSLRYIEYMTFWS